MDYNSIKKLDEESLKQLKESSGPSDKCICSLFTSPDRERKGIKATLKKAFGSISKPSVRRGGGVGGRSINLPLTFQRGGPGVFTTRRLVKRTGRCGKCSCDDEKFVLKESDLSIKITTPDISTICPCPTDCLPDKAKLQDNIKVTIEYAEAMESPWSRKPPYGQRQCTKDQVSSTLGQTKSIRTNIDATKSLEDVESTERREEQERFKAEHSTATMNQEESQFATLE